MVNHKAWIEKKLYRVNKRVKLEFGGIYTFDVANDLPPPIFIVTRAYTHALFGINLLYMKPNIRKEIIKEYKKIMQMKSGLRRNGKLFELERKLKSVRQTKESIVTYRSKQIVSRVAALDIKDIEELFK